MLSMMREIVPSLAMIRVGARPEAGADGITSWTVAAGTGWLLM
jgi:hypothetical protein